LAPNSCIIALAARTTSKSDNITASEFRCALAWTLAADKGLGACHHSDGDCHHYQAQATRERLNYPEN
jgi:hypothetical protein